MNFDQRMTAGDSNPGESHGETVLSYQPVTPHQRVRPLRTELRCTTRSFLLVILLAPVISRDVASSIRPVPTNALVTRRGLVVELPCASLGVAVIALEVGNHEDGILER